MRTCEEAAKEIQLIRRKIFLITGMAGQGKTIFICDIVDRQFRAFEIPSLFIPARELNAYRSAAKILSFILSNRYAPNTKDMHGILKLFNDIAAEMGKPFVIAIDGINEVSELDAFNAELKIFLNAVCQYDYVKVMLTCRSEFFDQKFRSIMDEPFKEQIHRIEDLKSKMSDEAKTRLLKSYLKHFRIIGAVSSRARFFLESDLLLLRIFCEINEGKDIGAIIDVYKGDLFSEFLGKKIRELPDSSQPLALPTLFRIASTMLASGDFSKLSVRAFDATERAIIQKFLAEDIVLRQELPQKTLSRAGDLTIAFTYDEMRDFIIAYYLVSEIAPLNIHDLTVAMDGLPGRPIFEGVFKYVYALARRELNADVCAVCEVRSDFDRHFALNLALLPSDIQTERDVERVGKLLESPQAEIVRHVAQFLFHRRDHCEKLNISILIAHLNSLPAGRHKAFVSILMSSPGDYGHDAWKSKIDELVDRVFDGSRESALNISDEAICFYMHLACYAEWESKERLASYCKRLVADGKQAWKSIAIQANVPSMKYLLDDVESDFGSSA
jgi:hypothetical protein